MELSLKGKNALVCGGSKGIGRATAVELAALGANVTLVARSAEVLAEVVLLLDNGQGQHHDFLVADFANTTAVKRKVKQLLAVKPIHILINNTGGPPGGPIVQAETASFLDAYQKHLLTSHLLTTLIYPKMIRVGYGRIINIISTSVKAPLDGLGVSNTTRGAVASWAKTMANELGQHGITVNNVLPGFTSTGRLQEIITNKATKGQVSEETVIAKMQSTVPLGRFAAPKEVAAAVAFLASPAAGYINGINLPVDGGRTRSL